MCDVSEWVHVNKVSTRNKRSYGAIYMWCYLIDYYICNILWLFNTVILEVSMFTTSFWLPPSFTGEVMKLCNLQWSQQLASLNSTVHILMTSLKTRTPLMNVADLFLTLNPLSYSVQLLFSLPPLGASDRYYTVVTWHFNARGEAPRILIVRQWKKNPLDFTILISNGMNTSFMSESSVNQGGNRSCRDVVRYTSSDPKATQPWPLFACLRCQHRYRSSSQKAPQSSVSWHSCSLRCSWNNAKSIPLLARKIK